MWAHRMNADTSMLINRFRYGMKPIQKNVKQVK